MENRIDAVVYNAVKNTLGTMNQTDIINSDNRLNRWCKYKNYWISECTA